MARKNPEQYSKVMVFGTAYKDSDGNLQLSEIGKRRGDKAAEAYYRDEKIKIHLSGGYSKDLFETQPFGSEAGLLADYLVKAYKIPVGALQLEEESTNTEENLLFSQEQYPEFFEGILSGQERIGVISQASHLGKVADLACRIDNWKKAQLVNLVAWQPKVHEKESKVTVCSAMGQLAVMASD